MVGLGGAPVVKEEPKEDVAMETDEVEDIQPSHWLSLAREDGRFEVNFVRPLLKGKAHPFLQLLSDLNRNIRKNTAVSRK